MGPERDRGSGPETPKISDRKHQEDLLDEALEESFPASDPPSPAQPHVHKPADGDEKKRPPDR